MSDDAERSAELRRGKVGFGLITAYGAGTLADSTSQNALNIFLFFYLTAVCGLSNSLAGAVGLISLSVDAIGDPLVGALSDNSWSRLAAAPVHVRRHRAAGDRSRAASSRFQLACRPVRPLRLRDRRLDPAARVAFRFLPALCRPGRGALRRLRRADAGGLGAVRVQRRRRRCLPDPRPVGVHGRRGRPVAPRRLRPLRLESAQRSCCSAASSRALARWRAIKRMRPLGRPEGPLAGRLRRDIVELGRNPSFRVLFGALLLFFVASGLVSALTLHANTFFWRLPTDCRPHHSALVEPGGSDARDPHQPLRAPPGGQANGCHRGFRSPHRDGDLARRWRG